MGKVYLLLKNLSDSINLERQLYYYLLRLLLSRLLGEAFPIQIGLCSSMSWRNEQLGIFFSLNKIFSEQSCRQLAMKQHNWVFAHSRTLA